VWKNCQTKENDNFFTHLKFVYFHVQIYYLKIFDLLVCLAEVKNESQFYVLCPQYTTITNQSDLYRISHGLWCDMIFIQFVVCFLSPSLIQLVVCFLIPEPWRGDRKHTKSYHITNHGRFFLSHIYHPMPVLLPLFFEGRGVGIHNVISKIITWVILHWCDKLSSQMKL
jgi:hypothetical protein